jgi:hypothetical protein
MLAVVDPLEWGVRNSSASLRAAIRSLLTAILQQRILSRITDYQPADVEFRRSCNQAAEVPSSKVSDKVPCSPWMNSTIVTPWSPAGIP